MAKNEMALLGAFGNKFWGKGKSCGSAMVLFERAVVISCEISNHSAAIYRWGDIRHQSTDRTILS